MCRLLIGLPIDPIGIIGWTTPIQVHVRTRSPRPSCSSCDTPARIKQTVRRSLTDLPSFGRPVRLVWHQIRWSCPDGGCTTKSWTETDPAIVHGRQLLTDRAGRWACAQVGRDGRAVAEVARELGCDWHTINDAVIAYGTPLIDDPDRIAEVTVLGMDEVKRVRLGKFKIKQWSTQIVAHGQLLDVVNGRDAASVCGWLAARDQSWRDRIVTVTIDMSGPYKRVADTMLPDAVQVIDAFHVISNANQRLDECRRRVQQDILGRRGHRDDPLFRARKYLVMAAEHLDDHAEARRVGLLRAGDPRGEVAEAWHAKEALREFYRLDDPTIAERWLDELIVTLVDPVLPPEVRKLGRMLRRWRVAILAFHTTRATNAATEAINNLAKRVKRVAFGIVNWNNWRTRVLLYAGRPDWSKIAHVIPAAP